MQQKCDAIRPKVPNWTKERGKQTKKQRGSAAGPQQDEQSQLSFCQPQREEKEADRRTETKKNVQHAGQLWFAQTQRPQQVVKQTGRQPKENGLQKDK